MALSVLLLLLAAVAQAQKAPTAKTDRIEGKRFSLFFKTVLSDDGTISKFS